MKSLLQKAFRYLPSERVARRLWIFLSVLLLALVIFLIDAKNPWHRQITERVSAGEALRVKEFIIIGLWWAAMINALITAFLLVSFRWWSRTIVSHQQVVPWLTAGKKARMAWCAAILGAMVLCLIVSWPRMFLSLWGDEGYSMRQVIVGNYKQLDDGTVELRRLSLAENLWTYKGPNNHFLFTIPARLAHDIWRKFFYADELEFNEFALRVPPLLAGLFAIPALALLLARMGFGMAGVLAAYFCSIHPWFIKYASEARGYSMVLLFAALACYSLLEAIRTTRLRWWLAFAFCNFCIMYAYPAALYLACTLGLAAAVMILTNCGWSASAWGQCVRLGLSSVLSAMLYLQLVAPAVPQMLLWLQRDRARGVQDFVWVRDFWAQLTTGMAWKEWATDNPLAHTVQDLQASEPTLYLFVLLVLPALALLGLLRLCLSHRNHAAIAGAFVLAPVLGFYQAAMSGNVLYIWYLIYALPALIAFVALALDWGGHLLKKHPRWGSATAFVLFAAFYIPATAAQMQTLRTHPIEPQRDSVQLTRPTLNPYALENKNIITATVAFGTKMYDALQIELESADQLRELMAEADRTGKPLFINFGSENFSRHVAPETVQIIEQSGAFTLVQRLYGMDVQNTRVVYRYTGNKPDTSSPILNE